MANAIAIRWSPRASATPPPFGRSGVPSPLGTGHDEAVRPLVGIEPDRAEPGDERGDAVALLDAQFGGAADRDLTAVRAERRDRGQFVNQARNFVRPDLDRPDLVVCDRHRSPGLAAVRHGRLDLDARAEPAEHVEQRGSRRVETDLFDLDARPWEGRRRDQPEGGRGEVAGHGELPGGETLAA